MRYQEKVDDLTPFNRGRLVYKKQHAFLHPIPVRKTPLGALFLQMLKIRATCYRHPMNGMIMLTSGLILLLIHQKVL